LGKIHALTHNCKNELEAVGSTAYMQPRHCNGSTFWTKKDKFGMQMHF